MKKIRIPFLLDSLFTLGITFIILFSIFRFYLRSLILAIFLSLIFAIMITLLISFLMRKKYQKRIISKENNDKEQKLMITLAISKKIELNNLLTSLFEREGFKITDCNKYLLATRGEEVKALYHAFTIEPLDADKLIEIRKDCPKLEILLFCNSINQKATQLASTLKIEIREIKNVYSALARYSLIPDLIELEEKNTNIKERLLNSLKRSNYKPILLSGLMILLLSFVSFYPIYYIVSGTILLFVATFIRYLGRT